MRVYPDANIYLRLLLAEPGEELANRFFKRSADCLFDLAVSKTTFGEVNRRCEGRGSIWLQDHLDKFKGAGKLVVVEKSKEDAAGADRLNFETGNEFGVNDFLHALLARRHADVLVTDDFRFITPASKIVKTMSLSEFLEFLKAKP